MQKLKTESNNNLPAAKKPTNLALKELSRPSLAVINEDYPKVRTVDVGDIESIVNFMLTILNIKATTQDEIQALDLQMVLVIDLIRTKFGFLTIPEIKEAFKMYVSKSFPGIKVFRILDCIAVGEILQAFTDYRSDSLREYSQKKQLLLTKETELTTEEKENIVLKGVQRAFEEYKKTKKIDEPSEYIFDFLVERKKIINNNNPAVIEYYQSKISQATRELKEESVNIKAANKAESRLIKEELDAIIGGFSPKIIIRAKRNILKEFFEKQIKLKQENIF